MAEEIYTSWLESMKKFISFSMAQEAATLNQYHDYVEQVGKIYSRAYEEFIRTYLVFPKTIMKTSEMTNSAPLRQREFLVIPTMDKPLALSMMHFEDFAVGASFSSGETIVSGEDIQSFADLTGDRNKLHIDNEFAKNIGFAGVIGHGLLSLSVAMGLWDSLALTNATTLALAGFSNVSFKAPVYPGDRLRLNAEVLAVRESKSKPTAGLVTLKFKLFNDKGALVMEAEPVLVISKKQSS